MRDLVVHALTSLDGFSADEGTGVMQRMGEIDDPAGDDLFAGRLAGAGTHVMGRVTYLGMAEFWPKSSHLNAAPLNDIPKVVFSRTLREASWPETAIASGGTAQEIARLKAEPGNEIIAHGGTQFVRSLVRLGLVERYRFYVVPVAAGAGVPLFAADADPGRLRVEQNTAYPGGIPELVYAPARRDSSEPATSLPRLPEYSFRRPRHDQQEAACRGRCTGCPGRGLPPWVRTRRVRSPMMHARPISAGLNVVTQSFREAGRLSRRRDRKSVV